MYSEIFLSVNIHIDKYPVPYHVCSQKCPDMYTDMSGNIPRSVLTCTQTCQEIFPEVSGHLHRHVRKCSQKFTETCSQKCQDMFTDTLYQESGIYHGNDIHIYIYIGRRDRNICLMDRNIGQRDNVDCLRDTHVGPSDRLNSFIEREVLVQMMAMSVLGTELSQACHLLAQDSTSWH